MNVTSINTFLHDFLSTCIISLLYFDFHFYLQKPLRFASQVQFFVFVCAILALCNVPDRNFLSTKKKNKQMKNKNNNLHNE